MRLALAPLLAAAALLATAASADVGPPPTCGAGTHHEYLYGHRCVPDGSHLEHDPAAGVVVIPNNAVGPNTPIAATASPAPTTAASSPPPAAPADPAPVPSAPPPSHGCACGVAASGGSAVGLLAGVAALAAWRIRRRARGR